MHRRCYWAQAKCYLLSLCYAFICSNIFNLIFCYPLPNVRPIHICKCIQIVMYPIHYCVSTQHFHLYSDLFFLIPVKPNIHYHIVQVWKIEVKQMSFWQYERCQYNLHHRCACILWELVKLYNDQCYHQIQFKSIQLLTSNNWFSRQKRNQLPNTTTLRAQVSSFITCCNPGQDKASCGDLGIEIEDNKDKHVYYMGESL